MKLSLTQGYKIRALGENKFTNLRDARYTFQALHKITRVNSDVFSPKYFIIELMYEIF